jgi:hypothetical protein
MIKNPSYSGKVRIDEEKNTAGFSGHGNPKSVSNVNQAQGPRTGNMAARTGKRTDFVEDKQSRAPLADVINDAFAARGHGRRDHVNPALESVHSNTNVKFRK